MSFLPQGLQRILVRAKEAKKAKKAILRGAGGLQEDSPTLPPFENKFIFQGGTLYGVFVYEKRRGLGDKSEIRGSLLKAVPEKERGYKTRDKGSRSFVIRRRPLSYIIIIDWAWQSLISFESVLFLPFSLFLSFLCEGGLNPGRKAI